MSSIEQAEVLTTSLGNAQALVDAFNQQADELVAAAVARKDLDELRTLRGIFKPEARQVLVLGEAIGVIEKGLPLRGERPVLDPVSLSGGEQVVYADPFLREPGTYGSNAVLERGTVEIVWHYGPGRARIRGVGENRLTFASVRWDWKSYSEDDPGDTVEVGRLALLPKTQVR